MIALTPTGISPAGSPNTIARRTSPGISPKESGLNVQAWSSQTLSSSAPTPTAAPARNCAHTGRRYVVYATVPISPPITTKITTKISQGGVNWYQRPSQARLSRMMPTMTASV